MSRRTSQKDNILAHLKQFGMITPLDALKQYGCFRLGAVIHTLRHEDGYNIKTTIANGDAKYAIYSLDNKTEELPDRTSMEQAADAEDPNYKNEYDLINETSRALGFGGNDE